MLALALAPASAQDEARDFNARVKALVERLGLAPDERARGAALDELSALADELESHLAELGEGAGRAFLPALYRAFSARAEFDRRGGDEQRENWVEAARGFAESWGDREAIVRAGLLHGNLWLESGRVRDTLVLARDLAREHAEAKLRPFVLFQGATAASALGEYTPALDLLDELERTAPGEAWTRELLCQVPALRAQVFNGMGVSDQAALFTRAGRECLDGLAAVGPNNSVLMDIQALNVELARGRFDPAAVRAEELLSLSARYPEGSPWRGTLLCILGQARLELERGSSAVRGNARAVLEQALACDLGERDRLRVHTILAHEAMDEAMGGARKTGENQLAVAASGIGQARALLQSWARRSGALGSVPEELQVATAELRLGLERGDSVTELGTRGAMLEAALAERMAAWRTLTPLRRGGSGFLQDASTLRAVAELLRWFARDDGGSGATLAFELLWNVQALGSIARGFGPPAGSIEAVRTVLLEEGRGLLVYFPGPNQSFVLALDRGEVSLHALPAAHVLEEARLALARARARSDVDAARSAAVALARGLLPPPIEQALMRWPRGLTIVGSELLGHPPFGLLLLSGGEHLGATLALDQLTSLPLGLLLAEREDPPAEAADLLVLAAPEVGPGVLQRFPELAHLDWSEDFKRTFASAADGGALRLLTGRDANLDNLRTALSGARALQFLVHGVRDDDLERPATLVLAATPGESGLLTCDGIESMGGMPELVLLTACRSSSGPVRRGDDGTGHLGGAFLRAGSRVVVLADEDLEFESARRLSARFHASLWGRGSSPAEALRAALTREFSEDPTRAWRPGTSLRVLGLGHRAFGPAPAPESVVPQPRASPAEEVDPGDRAPESRMGLLGWGAFYLAVIAVLSGSVARRMYRKSA